MLFEGVPVERRKDLETVAADIRRRARVPASEVVLAPVLARGLCLQVANGAPGIIPHERHGVVRVSPDDDDLNFAIATVIARVFLARLMPELRDEQAVRFVATAMLVPRKLLSRTPGAWRTSASVARLANRFGVTQTTMSLRIAEATGQPRAVITRKNDVHTRGIAVPERQLVLFARHDEVKLPGLRKAKLSGRDDGRVAVAAAS